MIPYVFYLMCRKLIININYIFSIRYACDYLIFNLFYVYIRAFIFVKAFIFVSKIIFVLHISFRVWSGGFQYYILFYQKKQNKNRY